jgi:glyoxylase-like metal-dependent hydrolase (beta-lactamase superfamily II)
MSLVELTPLGHGIHRITHPLPYALDHVHTYALDGADGWTIVDAGHVWHAAERWRDALGRLGNPRVSDIVVTHHHPDHVAGSAALQQLTGARLVQGRLDNEITTRMYDGTGFEGVTLERPARLLDDGDVLDAGGRVYRILHLPGHADGHIVLYDEQRGTLFGGDVILDRITPNVSWWPGMMRDPLALYYRTLERLEELAPAVVYPGHEATVTEARRRARELREHHDARLDETERHLRAGAATADEVLARLWDRELTPHERRFAYGEAVAHLQRLEQLGRAAEVAPDRWHAVAG